MDWGNKSFLNKAVIFLVSVLVVFLLCIALRSLKNKSEIDELRDELNRSNIILKDLQEQKYDEIIMVGLVGYWPFDNTNNNSVKDIANNNDAVNNNAIYTAEGKTGEACYFDGETSYISIPDSEDFNMDKGAISFWIYPELSKANQSFGGILHYRKGGCCSDYLIIRLHQDKNKDYLKLISEINNSQTMSVQMKDSSIKESEWNHVIIQQTGEGIEIFLNGEKQELVGKNSNDWFADHYPANYDFTIGDKGSWTDNKMPAYFKGIIDELKIWNRALTPEEITFISEQ